MRAFFFVAALVVREVVVCQRQGWIPCCRAGPLRQLARPIRFGGFLLDLFWRDFTVLVATVLLTRRNSIRRRQRGLFDRSQEGLAKTVAVYVSGRRVPPIHHGSRKLDGEESNTFGRMVTPPKGTLFLVIVSGLDMTRSSLLASIQKSNHQKRASSGPTKCCLVVLLLLILSSSDFWIHLFRPFVGFIKL